jgi:hypothetical protein
LKRFAVIFILALVLTLPLVLGLACKVDTPAAPNNLQTGLQTVVAGNPTLTSTPTATATATATSTPTPCTGIFGTPTPGSSTFTDANNLYLNQYTASSPTTLTTLTVWTVAGGQVEAGIYADTGTNAPASLLGETGAQGAPVGAGVFSLPTPVVLNGSTPYWLALHASGAVDFSGANSDPTFTSPIGPSFAGLPVSVNGGSLQATPGLSSPATILSMNGTTCP